MAYDIALVVEASHTAVTNTKNMLEGNGHTCTVITKADIGTPDLSGYDIIIFPRGPNSEADTDYVRGESDDHSIPMITGVAGGVNNGVDLQVGQAYWLGIAERLTQTNGIDEIDVTAEVHDITDGYASTDDVQVQSANDYSVFPQSGDNYVGTILSYHQDDTDRISILAIDSGTADLNANNFEANVAHIDFCYGLQGYSSDGETIFEQAIEWCVGGEEPPVSVVDKAYMTVNTGFWGGLP